MREIMAAKQRYDIAKSEMWMSKDAIESPAKNSVKQEQTSQRNSVNSINLREHSNERKPAIRVDLL